MKQLAFAPILFVVTTTIALGDHGGDLLAGVPLWQILTVAASAVVVFFLVTSVRRQLRRRRACRTTRPHFSEDNHVP